MLFVYKMFPFLLFRFDASSCLLFGFNLVYQLNNKNELGKAKKAVGRQNRSEFPQVDQMEENYTS